jgi:hypothetical protein
MIVIVLFFVLKEKTRPKTLSAEIVLRSEYGEDTSTTTSTAYVSQDQAFSRGGTGASKHAHNAAGQGAFSFGYGPYRATKAV